MLSTDKSHPQTLHYLNVILNISQKPDLKDKSTRENDGLSLLLKSGLFDEQLHEHWKQDTRAKKPPGPRSHLDLQV